MKKLDLNNFSIEELQVIKDALTESKDLDTAIEKVNSIIEYKNNPDNINVKLDIEMLEKYHFFPPQELEIIKANGIKNLEELHTADLGQFKGMTRSSREYIEWGREFFYYIMLY